MLEKQEKPLELLGFEVGAHCSLDFERLSKNRSEEKGEHHNQKPCLLVIFGGTGDLSNRKLLPAVYNLCYEALSQGKTLPYAVLSVGRRPWTSEQYRESVRTWIQKFTRKPFDDALFERFAQKLFYYEMDLAKEEAYDGLFAYFEEKAPHYEKLYYYAVAPHFFAPISRGLARNAEVARRGRVIIEKPFGENLEQARQLNQDVAAVMGEDRVLHIDHYLGKEMVQNILTLRFENALFEQAWSRELIEAVEITAAEEVGVETRGGYYDEAGALRDMVQNHLFQILSILAMEKPEDSSAEALCKAQTNLLAQLKPLDERWLERFVAAQYEGYRNEPKVHPDSKTETYAALVVHIDNPRWQGVPFVIRTGKKLARRGTFVTLHFRKTPLARFANRLQINIQPEEGVQLRFNIKKPGLGYAMQAVEMNFCQSCQVEAHENTPEAYERLIRYAAAGRRELFSQWPQIEASWRWVEDLRARWEAAGCPLASYPAASEGPLEATALALHNGVNWTQLGEN